jgi:hypothetical protein
MLRVVSWAHVCVIARDCWPLFLATLRKMVQRYCKLVSNFLTWRKRCPGTLCLDDASQFRTSLKKLSRNLTNRQMLIMRSKGNTKSPKSKNISINLSLKVWVAAEQSNIRTHIQGFMPARPPKQNFKLQCTEERKSKTQRHQIDNSQSMQCPSRFPRYTRSRCKIRWDYRPNWDGNQKNQNVSCKSLTSKRGKSNRVKKSGENLLCAWQIGSIFNNQL